jgi:hypothetical protein
MGSAFQSSRTMVPAHRTELVTAFHVNRKMDNLPIVLTRRYFFSASVAKPMTLEIRSNVRVEHPAS